jgi:CubicO group peptidase (beta-lactamase class C family)
MLLRSVVGIALACAGAAAAADIWPGKDWDTATPASQGMSAAGLDEAAAYAERHGGGSGCVVRHGYLVKEWGSPTTRWDIKSATKGSLGTTCLGLAVDAGLVKLDDLAQKHYAAIGTEKDENDADWLKEITVRHLATMTAGFDDGRPPKLVYRPGTKGIYSNDTSNMLAELLTLKYGEDLSAVVKREVMDPIGVPADEWRWRANQVRSKTINDLASREFASGLTITHRALARIGYLYLRVGRWKDKQIVSREYIKTATTPTKLPAPFPYYAFYWGSNALGTYSGMPKDAYWALGLGDSFVVVCPSLDIVAVRLGVGNKKSQLPGGDDDWGKRVEGFFRLVVRGVQDPPPPSPVIKDVRWAPADTIIRLAKGSDNWPMTWADDDALYTAYGDGWGFDPRRPEKLSLGFAKVLGHPPEITASNIPSPTGEQKGDGPKGKKASGILSVDGVLYLWTRNAGNAQLAWSANRGKTWSWADWKLTTSFGCPTFLNFGKDYAQARDDFVYVYSPDADAAYDPADCMVLARVAKARIKDREAYEFLRKLDDGRPVWTKDVKERGAVLADAGRCYRSAITYDIGLKRYLWCVTRPAKDRKGTYGLAIYDAPEPWGPWTTAYVADPWDMDAGESCGFPSKWISADGKTLHLVFAGGDAFCVRKAALVLAASRK